MNVCCEPGHPGHVPRSHTGTPHAALAPDQSTLRRFAPQGKLNHQSTTMTPDQLIALENKYWDAMITRDVDTAVGMSDDPCYVTGAQGVSAISKEQYRKLMTDGTWQLHEYSMDKIQARLLTPDVAIVAYTVTEKLTVEGKPLTMKANDSSTWVRRNGEWKCALHTEAVAGDPYGRDRKPA
jgi:ketosteroid isomerase-like protein